MKRGVVIPLFWVDGEIYSRGCFGERYVLRMMGKWLPGITSWYVWEKRCFVFGETNVKSVREE